MDIDAALRALRDDLRKLAFENDSDRVPDPAGSIVNDALDHFEAIDQWLKKGGALPKDWKVGR